MKDYLKITNEDNMELMSRYPDNYFELAIVDPPYRDENQPTKDMRKNGSMESIQGRPKKDYWDNLFRISKNQIIWGANNFELPQWKGFVVWKKKTISQNFTMSMCELASLSEGLSTTSKWIEIAPQGTKDDPRIHPTQKPVALYQWLLQNYAGCKTCKNQGGYFEDVAGDGGSQMWIGCDDCYDELNDTNSFKILDTHLGSGSIAIAVDSVNKIENMNLTLTACELDKEYFDKAIERIENETKWESVFAEEKVNIVEQGELF